MEVYSPPSWVPSDPNFKERIQFKIKGNAFMHFIGFSITEIEAGYVKGELVLNENHFQQFGRVHGGVITTLADIVAGFAAYTCTPADKDVVTGEIKISCFRPGKGAKIIAVGRVVKPGRTLTFAEADVYCEENGVLTHVANATTSMVNIPLVQ